MELFKQAIIQAYEPIEDYRVGKIMDEFLDDFSRKSNHEVVDFNNAWHKELQKVEKLQMSCLPSGKHISISRSLS